ncbi:hypothetical protein [Rubritalea tangerina]|uniref:Uncharacterized protein n=1 Tax=Rubritalea tangerina TaxID=430798 RepID=A0ABW4Z900_9BACT
MKFLHSLFSRPKPKARHTIVCTPTTPTVVDSGSLTLSVESQLHECAQATSLLELPFDQAASPSLFAEHIQRSSEDDIRDQLNLAAKGTAKNAIASANFVMGKRGVEVVFKDGIPKGLELMKDKLGRQLPTLVDSKTRRTVETARVVGKGAKAAKAGAAVALIVVEAAHMISGADQMKKLRKIEAGVAELLHNHESELRSRLESMYRHSKEIITASNGKLSDFDRMEISTITRDLMELRAQWREKYLYKLKQIDKANPSFFKKWLPGTREASLKKSLSEKVTEAESALEAIQWMHFSLMLQMTLSAYTGRIDTFMHHTLADELVSWEKVINETTHKAKEISGSTNIRKEWDDFLDGLRSVPQVWETQHKRHLENAV